MEKRAINIERKKEVKPPKKQKQKPTVKKVFRKKTEKREMRFNSMNDII